MLYYYSNKLNKQSQGSSLRQSRFTFLNQRTPYQGEEATLGYHTIDLHTSTLKLDAEQKDLRFCFRIISPAKSYTLQGENKADQMDWIEKITGVIASLLHSPFPRQLSSKNSHNENNGVEYVLEEQQQGYDNVSKDLRSIPGNEVCAECRAPEPDWASLNLGILMCIECSGVHRNLGVHISKVRSLRLDVKVWEPVICDLFHALGNTYANSIWEGSLLKVESNDELNEGIVPIEKPNPSDTLVTKEKYIQIKYVERLLIAKEPDSHFVTIWDAIKSNDVKMAYRLLVANNINPNMRYYEPEDDCHDQAESTEERMQFDPLACQRIASSGQQDSCMEGCSPLHFACHFADPTMIELFVQFGSHIDLQDFHGRTPLHHCVFTKNDALAKYLLKRGAKASIKDGGNLTAFERRMEMGAITDEELLILFAG